MSRLETADGILDLDDPTWGMHVYEDDEGFKTRLIVNRGGHLVGLVIHHGRDEEYSGRIPPLFVPSVAGENPVGLMLQMSEEHRHDLRYWKYSEELRQSSTLIQDAIRTDERAHLAARNQSVFGPHQTTQRNGHSSITVRREWWAERARRTGQVKSYRKQDLRP